MRRVFVDPGAPQRDAIEEAAKWILTAGVVAPPTSAPALSGGTGKIGVRVPAYAVTRAICHAVGRPITATSANRSGEPPTAHRDHDPDRKSTRLNSSHIHFS